MRKTTWRRIVEAVFLAVGFLLLVFSLSLIKKPAASQGVAPMPRYIAGFAVFYSGQLSQTGSNSVAGLDHLGSIAEGTANHAHGGLTEPEMAKKTASPPPLSTRGTGTEHHKATATDKAGRG